MQDAVEKVLDHFRRRLARMDVFPDEATFLRFNINGEYQKITVGEARAFFSEMLREIGRHIAPLREEINRLTAQRDEAPKESFQWKASFEAQNGEICRLADEREDLDDAVGRLSEIGRAVGCEHHDYPDGRLQLVNCVTQTIDSLTAQRDELLAACKTVRDRKRADSDFVKSDLWDLLDETIARAEAGQKGDGE